MIRFLFSCLMAVHGIIHLIGFVREFKLHPTGGFSGKTLFTFSENMQKFAGILWLITCMLLIAASAVYYLGKDWYWILAGTGLLLSQALIIVYWQDARGGTIVNVVILIVLVFSVASLRFKTTAKAEADHLVSAASKNNSEVTEEKISELPPVVQAWLRNANVMGTTMPSSVHITQKGSMRTEAGGDWMPFEAEQWFTFDPPGFVWTASIHTDAMIDIVGRDKYERGKGNMIIKAASLIPIANSSGNEIDEGTMIRYMAELAWFPQAALSDYLEWQQLDDHHARITMTYEGITATGIYTFNGDGLPSAFEAQRWGDFKGKLSKETWSVSTTGFRTFNGIPIGTTSEVTWKLKEEDFTWLRLEVTDIE